MCFFASSRSTADFAPTPSPRANSSRCRRSVYSFAASRTAIRTQVDPDVYVVLDEKLFLFSNADARTAFESEEPGIVQVADGKWAELESERAQKKGCFSCF